MADNNLENRVNHLETKVSVIETKVDMFIDEMRDRDNQRAAEIARVDSKIEQLREQREKDNAKHEADMKEINKKIDEKVDNITKEIRSMAITTILGVGAIVAAVMGFSWAIFAPSNPAPVQIQQPPAQTAQIQTIP